MKNSREPNRKSPEGEKDYLKAAKDLKKMNEMTLAIEVCDKGLKKNQKDSNIYILKSQIYIDIFKKKKDPSNLKSALLNLEKALKLNPQSYIARILASQICLKGKAYKKAKSLLAGVLKSLPDDEKATSMMAYIAKKEKKALAVAAAEKTATKAVDSDDPTEGDIIVKSASEADKQSENKTEEEMVDTRPEDDHWIIDDKLVIDSDDDEGNSAHIEKLIDKLTMFGRLDGLKAIFLVDNSGQLIKAINKSGLDENVIPSMVFNLYKASVMGMRRIGYGSFQKGTLTAPIGTVIVVNVFYAILALVIDRDADIGPVESRLQRYLSEVTE